jgi:hypothetical protein
MPTLLLSEKQLPEMPHHRDLRFNHQTQRLNSKGLVVWVVTVFFPFLLLLPLYPLSLSFSRHPHSPNKFPNYKSVCVSKKVLRRKLLHTPLIVCVCVLRSVVCV